jgi:hypothetical protein
MNRGFLLAKRTMEKVNTTARLAELRSLFAKTASTPISAFLIPGADSHQVACPLHGGGVTVQSEYIADCDQRRTFISGFNGSSGMHCCWCFTYDIRQCDCNSNCGGAVHGRPIFPPGSSQRFLSTMSCNTLIR